VTTRVDAVRRTLADTPGDALCNVCLAIACRTSLSEMRQITTQLLEDQSIARRTCCTRCGRDVVTFVNVASTLRVRSGAADPMNGVSPADGPRSERVSDADAGRERPVAGSLIAVVDDDVSVRRGLERLLTAVGYRVSTFASGRELLDSHVAQASSCLVLDVRMPGLSGVAVHDALKAAGLRIPVVFITGDAEIPETTRMNASASVAVLSKPVDDDQLFATVQRLIATSETRSEIPASS
jgi:CheY-like chemotaxis protein